MSEPILIDTGDNVSIVIDWSDAVLPDTLVSVVHTLPSPLVKGPEGTDTTGLTSNVRVSGVVHGGLYRLEAQASLTTGETLNRQVSVRGWNS